MVLCWWLFSEHVRRLWTPVTSLQHCVCMGCAINHLPWSSQAGGLGPWKRWYCCFSLINREGFVMWEGVVEMVVLASLWLCACDYVEGWGALTLVCTALMWVCVFVQHWWEHMYLWLNPWPQWYRHLLVVCILNTHMENPLIFGPTGR